MSDVARLRAGCASGDLLAPDADVPNLVDLANALALLCGVRDIDATPGAQRIAREIGEADHIVFALIDGLGSNLIERMGENSFLRSHAGMELRSVFPSSTAPALTSLATALWPAEHAVPAWWTYLPEYALTSTILLFIERFAERPLVGLGVEPERVFTRPPFVTRMPRDSRLYLPKGIADSVYTRYATGGGAGHGYGDLADGIDAIIARVQQSHDSTYTYLYFPVIDGLQHALGPEHATVTAACRALDRQLARLAQGLGGRGRLVVTADHGLISVPESGKHLLAPEDELLQLLRLPPSGEPRVPFFHVRAGAHARFAALFRERLGEYFALLTADEAQELRLFGPVPLSPDARARIGDFVGVALGPDVLLSSPMEYRGFHGGLAPDEMRVPLIIA